MDTFFVYALFDPIAPDEIRYIGQTRSLTKRRHAYRWGPVGYWKWCVEFFGRSIDVRLIDVVHGSKHDALRREADVIRENARRYPLMNAVEYRARQWPLSKHFVRCFELDFARFSRVAFDYSDHGRAKASDLAIHLDEMQSRHASLQLCTSPISFSDRRLIHERSGVRFNYVRRRKSIVGV